MGFFLSKSFEEINIASTSIGASVATQVINFLAVVKVRDWLAIVEVRVSNVFRVKFIYTSLFSFLFFFHPIGIWVFGAFSYSYNSHVFPIHLLHFPSYINREELPDVVILKSWFCLVTTG